MRHDSIFGNSVFGDAVTGQDAMQSRPIRPGDAVTIGSAVAVHPSGAVLNARGETQRLPINATISGAPRIVDQGYNVGSKLRVGFTPHAAATAYDAGHSRLIAGTVHPADRPYPVGGVRYIAGTAHPADQGYRVGAQAPIAPQQVVYGAGGGVYAPPSFGPKHQGVFHLPPRVGRGRYAQPHAFGPPVVGGGAVVA